MDWYMRAIILLLALLASVASASAQSATQGRLDSGINSGLGSSMNSDVQGGVGSGFEADLGPSARRTLADPFNPDAPYVGGAGCAPLQADPDHKGCRPYEWLRSEGRDPNRIISYYGDKAFRSELDRDPNRVDMGPR